MDSSLFRNSPVGSLIPIEGTDALGRAYDHFAFVPNPLPSSIELSDATWNEITAATLALGRLDGEGRRLPNPRVLSRPLIRAEAVSSSALEGTYTTLPQVLQAELLSESGDSDIREVVRQIQASELGFDAIEQGKPLSLRLIREMHGALMRDNPRCSPQDRGAWRTKQNFIGSRPDSRLEDAKFVPPPAGDTLEALLHDWETWIHERPAINALAKVALAHYQFEALHPFTDGNGRIGRLISILQLVEYGVLTASLLNLSPYLEANQDEYQSLLLETSREGCFDKWVHFYSKAIHARADAVLLKIDALMAFREKAIDAIRKARYRGIITFIIDDLVGHPIITPTVVRKTYGVTYMAATYALENLEREKVIDRVPYPDGRRRLYVANEVMAIIHG